MGLETGTYISDLNSANPVGTDVKSQGDDHIRLLKATILATFPAITGAVTSTHTELNLLDGITGTVWSSDNDGAGSGLDADTLDTYEASAFPRLAAANTFTTRQNIALTYSVDFVMNQTDASANQKKWLWRVSNDGIYGLYAWNDSEIGAYTAMQFTRSGVTVTQLQLNATSFDFNGALDVSGAVTLANNETRIYHSSGFLSFYNTGNTTRSGFLLGGTSGFSLANELSAQPTTIRTNSGVINLSVNAGTTNHLQMQTDGSITTPNSVAGELGYKGMPQQAQNGNYTLVLGDASKSVVYAGSGGHTYTIPANASVAYPVGTTITLANRGSGSITVAITTDNLYWGGVGSTGSRTLASWGIATIHKVTSTTWIISGAGLS